MEISVYVTVGNWSEEKGEARVDVTMVGHWPEALPWEALCAGLVQQAIAEYREKNEEAE